MMGWICLHSQKKSRKLQPKKTSFHPMKLQLTRPIAFIDLETTGVNISTDRIIELAVVKIMPDGSRQVKRKLINPLMPIPAGSSEIHGITDEMVKDAPSFKQVANEVKQFIDNCDLAGYNSNRFDIPMLIEEFLRIGIDFSTDGRRLVDVQKVFHMMEQRTLSAAYKFYCQKNLDGAHSAEADATATWEVLEAQVERYPQIGNTVESIVKFTGEDDIVDFARRFVKDKGVEVFNFGKHKGKPVVQVLKEEPQYYDWMMKGDFAMNTKQKLTEILNRTLLKKG
ncbi:DNA polymerase-3 subunit epsilon [Sediminibacterium ginsengisoli]|uniref:DNA polymerase-3 subunit epsilon n=2 Tax=Sediminibacterium ginsengisoli TaxID=413434 RepID=A0A1T4RY59_9BACT|nr:DNA polymerase-3 subunit epsilon [Sediminibacterium ginsengisoli]